MLAGLKTYAIVCNRIQHKSPIIINNTSYWYGYFFQYKDLLQLMIDAGDKQIDEGEVNSEDQMASLCSTLKKATGRGLSDGEIAAHVTVFLRAGYETTAYTLTYTSYLLALNPDIQQKVQSEIDNYFNDNPVKSQMEVHH